MSCNTAQGLNQKKNVILVLVESLGCNFTYICGSGPAYMPKVEKIAKNLHFVLKLGYKTLFNNG